MNTITVKKIKKKIGIVIESYWSGGNTIATVQDMSNNSKYKIGINGFYNIEFGDEIFWHIDNDKKICWYSFNTKQTRELNKVDKIVSISS